MISKIISISLTTGRVNINFYKQYSIKRIILTNGNISLIATGVNIYIGSNSTNQYKIVKSSNVNTYCCDLVASHLSSNIQTPKRIITYQLKNVITDKISIERILGTVGEIIISFELID